MKKRIYTVLIALLLCFIAVIPVFSQNNLPRLVDNADLLTENEENSLLENLDEISERQKFDIVIVTVNTLNGKTPRAYADDFYDYNGYGFGNKNDGVLLLINMKDRDWYMSTTGFGITAITDSGREYISNKFLPYLSNGDYAEAFNEYAELCDDFVSQAKTGEPYDLNNMPKSPFNWLRSIIISVIAGVVVAWIITSVMKGQLRTVRSQSAASDYIKSDSLKVTESRDLFLYRHIDRKAKPEEDSSGGSSTHTSSSGTTHGGGGGKF